MHSPSCVRRPPPLLGDRDMQGPNRHTRPSQRKTPTSVSMHQPSTPKVMKDDRIFALLCAQNDSGLFRCRQLCQMCTYQGCEHLCGKEIKTNVAWTSLFVLLLLCFYVTLFSTRGLFSPLSPVLHLLLFRRC